MTFYSSRHGGSHDMRPDYTMWAAKEVWSISEASKLICGRDPHGRIPGTQAYNKEKRVIDIIDAAFAVAKEGGMKVLRDALLPIHVLVEPGSFLKWALSVNLTIPSELSSLATMVDEAARVSEPQIIRERVIAIAKTLWVLCPTLTTAQIAQHEAMRQQVAPGEVTPANLQAWLLEAKG